ncbi:MAG: hypothetical protein U0360_01865 [Dehalococcoidia bacterium]
MTFLLGDLFFDIEGDPFYSDGEVDAIDYLFETELANTEAPTFHAIWSLNAATGRPAAERAAFEQLIDLFMERLGADPAMHARSPLRRTSPRPSSGWPDATARARTRWTSCCAGTCSWIRTARCGRASARRWRATSIKQLNPLQVQAHRRDAGREQQHCRVRDPARARRG